jgi:glyoxylase-like metal-dependent hydrolase (beta-lactamase superfamily II)
MEEIKLKKSSSRLALALLLFLVTWLQAYASRDVSGKSDLGKGFTEDGKLVFVTLVASPTQERQAGILIKSIREFAGKYKNSEIFVMQGDAVNAACSSLTSARVKMIPLEYDNAYPLYPFIKKMYALAQIEKILAGKAETMVWMDADSLVLKEPTEFALARNKKIAIRPVNLSNNVGLPASEPVDPFWKKIYEMTGLTMETVPIMETYVDRQMVRTYLNCAIFAIRPDLGIFRQGLDLFKKLLNDQEFQGRACKLINHHIFLHQAVLSALIAASIKEDEIHWFSDAAGYPLHHIAELIPERKAKKMNDLESLVYAYSWGTANWMWDDIQVDEPLKKWLAEKYETLTKVTGDIYREESLCNSYLVKTKDGYVMIDPGGASDAAKSILFAMNVKPKAILLTHAHTDHTTGIELWKFNKDIPVIAQEKHKEFFEYNFMLAGYFAAKNAIQGNVITEKELKIRPNIFFDREYTYELGGFHFKMIHTPGETPDHSTIWVPELKAAFIGDNYYTEFPNLAPLRGSRPRWALEYIGALNTVLQLQPEMVFPGHGEPIIGKSEVQAKLKKYRDAIQYVHDKTVKGLNEGQDVFTLMHEIRLPEEYKEIGEGYGKIAWAVRAIYESYTGWFDGNPAHMYDVSPASVYPDLVLLAGGADKIVNRANEFISAGEPVKALYLTDVILAADSRNKPALQSRLRAFQALRIKCGNFIEFQFLNYGSRTAFKKLIASQ